MAEDQVLTTGNALPAASAGIGAVIDTNETGLKNEDDAIKTANDYVAQQRKNQQAAFANSQVIMKGLNLKPDGARPRDIPLLQDKAAKIMDNAALLMGSFNGNLSSPAAQQAWFQNVVRPQQEFEANVQKSKGIAKLQLDADNELKSKPDFYNWDTFNQTTAHVASMHLDDPLLDKVSMSDWVQKKPPEMLSLYDKIIKERFPKGVETATPGMPEGGDPGSTYSHKISQNIDDAGINYLTQHIKDYKEARQITESNWQKMKDESPAAVNAYIDPYIKAGANKEEAEYKGQQDWIKGNLLALQATAKDDWIKTGDTTAAKAQRAEMSHFGYKPNELSPGDAEIAANFSNGRPNYENAIKQIKLDPYTTYETVVKDDPYNEGKKLTTIEPKTHENNIVGLKKNDNGTFLLVTSKMIDDAKQAGMKDANADNIAPMPFPTVNTLYSYLANKGAGGGSGWFQKIDNYYTAKGAKKPDGTWDTEKLVPSSTWNKNSQQTTQQPQRTISGNIPKATRETWKANGWTDEGIEKAKKLGKISVDGE